MIDGKMRMVLIQAMTENQVNRQNELEHLASVIEQHRRKLALLWLRLEELNQAIESSERARKMDGWNQNYRGLAELN